MTCLELFETVRTVRNSSELFRTIQNGSELFGTARNCSELSWNHLELFRSARYYSELFAIVLELSGTAWNVLNSSDLIGAAQNWADLLQSDLRTLKEFMLSLEQFGLTNNCSDLHN